MPMMCPKCGKLIEGGAVRCPDCGAEFDLQYAPPRLEPGPSQLQQTQPTVIPKNVPVGKAKHSPGWWVGVVALLLVLIVAAVIIIYSRIYPTIL